MSAALGISGTIHHVIAIYGTPVQNDFFKILVFRVFKGLEGQKMVQNDKIFCLSHPIFQENSQNDKKLCVSHSVSQENVTLCALVRILKKKLLSLIILSSITVTRENSWDFH